MATGGPDHSDELLVRAVQSIRDAVGDIELAVSHDPSRRGECHAAHCRRFEHLCREIEDAIVVIDGTRTAFKSRALADLRVTLENALREVGWRR